MKKTKKISIIVAVVLIIIGLLISFIGAVSIGFDFTELNMRSIVTNTHTVNEEFTSISIKNTECDVRFAFADDNACKVVCQESNEALHTVEVKNGTLTISETDDRKWYDYIGVFWGDMEIVVYLPESEYSALTVSNTTGDIAVPNDFSFGNVKLTTSTGNIEISADRVGDLYIKSDTGDITASYLSLSGDVAAETDTGNIQLGNISCQNINLKSDTGDITLKDIITANKVDIESDTGDVGLLECDAADIRITTDTGDVSGILLSEKMFITKSDTGEIDVPESTSDDRCKITTDTGNIKIKIK